MEEKQFVSAVGKSENSFFFFFPLITSKFCKYSANTRWILFQQLFFSVLMWTGKLIKKYSVPVLQKSCNKGITAVSANGVWAQKLYNQI